MFYLLSISNFEVKLSTSSWSRSISVKKSKDLFAYDLVYLLIFKSKVIVLYKNINNLIKSLRKQEINLIKFIERNNLNSN